jgi:hypothetical protein
MKNLHLLLLIIPLISFSQVGINTTTPNAMLDVQSTNNGILIPRVQLTSILDNTTVVNPNSGPLPTSTLVYNNGSAGVAPNNVIAGFYYWNANAVPAQWIPIAGNIGWNINGNSNTNTPVTPATYGVSTIGVNENYIGTTNANDFTIGTNNIERMRVKATTGNVGIGIAQPTQPLHVYKNSNANKSAILGQALQTSTTIDYQNIGIQGYGRGTPSSGGYGYGIGVMGVGDIVNSYHATGIYAYLGENAPNAPISDQALYANGNNIGNAARFVAGNVTINTGNLGVGTANPTALVHINSNTAGAFRLVDGTQANGSILTSNADGVATWQRPGIDNVVGTLHATGVNISYTRTNYIQTGSRIVLPPGRFAVNITMLLARNSTTSMSPNNSFFWVRSTFSDSNGIDPSPSPDIIGSNLASGNFPGTSQYAMLTGTIIINNTTAGNKTYYYVAGNCVSHNTTETLTNFGSTYWAENNIVAYRLN